MPQRYRLNVKSLATVMCSGVFAGASWMACPPAFAQSPATASAEAAARFTIVEPAAEGFSADRLDRLASFMRSTTDANGYLGAVTLVARHGRIVEWRAFGSLDVTRSVPMRRDSIFRIYSMTKTVTAVAAMVLLEEGKLGLDDPIARYLPEFANSQVMVGGTADAPVLHAPVRPVTVRHLLTFTSGLAVGGPGMDEATKLLERAAPSEAIDLQDFTSRVSRAPLGAEPGLRFIYDGVGIEVLSRLIEVVSGQPFDVFLQQRIFDPLNMVDTGFVVPLGKRARVVDLTAMGSDGKLVRGPSRSAQHPGEALNKYASGAGGLYATAPDYFRFAQMLLNGGTLDGRAVLGRKSVELMMTDQLAQLELPNVGLAAGDGFGLGGSVTIDVARRGRLGSLGAYGWSGAASTYYTIDPKERLVAMLFMQHLHHDDAPDLTKISPRFYNLVYQAMVDTPELHRAKSERQKRRATNVDRAAVDKAGAR